MTFNRNLAHQMYGVTNEKDLRDKLYGTRTDLTDPEFETIVEFLEEFNTPQYCEIGVYFGGNFKRVNEWLTNNKESFHMFGVDLFERLESEVQHTQTHDLYNKWNILNVAFKDELDSALSKFGCANYSLHIGNSHATVRQLPKSCDVFFIDGNHTYAQTLADAESCITVANNPAYLIFHNASNSIKPDPQYVARDGGPWAVCNILKERKNVEYVKLVDRCAVLKITNG